MIDAYVIGDELTSLVVALELAEVGLTVRVGLTGEELPTAPERDTGGSLAQLCETLAAPVSEGAPGHEHLAPMTTGPDRVVLRGKSGAWGLAPDPSVLGIPAVPLSRESTALLGGGAAFRAYLDRIRPILTIGKTRWLEKLVSSRIGSTARSVLVEPLVRERYGCASSEVEVAIAAPGLNETMSRTGSLTGAVLAYAERNVARETRVMPRAGWAELRRSLLERLGLYSVDVVAERVTQVSRVAGAESGKTESGETEETFRLTCQSLASSEGDSGETIAARAVIVGTRVTSLADVTSHDHETRPGAAVRELSVSSLAPRRYRAYAAIGISEPECFAGVTNGGPGTAVGTEVGTDMDVGNVVALTSVVDADDCWTVRVTRADTTEFGRSGGATFRAEWRGPAVSPQIRDSDGPVLAPIDTAVLERMSAQLGLNRQPDAEWCSRWDAAPHPTHEARAQQEEVLDTFREAHPLVVATGAVLHGGNLSVALNRAQADAVELRRRLLGLGS